MRSDFAAELRGFDFQHLIELEKVIRTKLALKESEKVTRIKWVL